MAGPLALNFVSSYPRARDMPATEAEIALVGRSNVGKSSLLNALAQRKQLARTSKTPGATRLLNAFELGPEGSGRWVVDLPGYGYAKASKAEQGRWSSMAAGYLADRAALRGVLHLIDGEIGPTNLDLQTVEWLDSLDLPVTYVATKADKVRPSRRGARKADLAAKLGAERGTVQWTSASKGTGIGELRSLVAALLSASADRC
jgi:GTP-binding protein